MRDLKFLLFLLLMLGINVYAQEKTPEKWATQHTDSLQKTIALTGDQYPKVYDIELAFAKNLETIKASGSSKMEKFKQLKEADEKRDEDLKAVLSEEQFKKYSDGKKEMRSEARENYKAKRKK